VRVASQPEKRCGAPRQTEEVTSLMAATPNPKQELAKIDAQLKQLAQGEHEHRTDDVASTEEWGDAG
jgi:hypothetical protein